MKVLFIYRNQNMGFSIERALKPIEKELRNYCDITTLYMPGISYMPWDLWRNIRACVRYVSEGDFDIVHITGTEHYMIPFLHHVKVIATIHDLGFYTYHRRSLKAPWKYLLWILPIKRADFLTFISETSRQETIGVIGIKLLNTSVVPNCVSQDYVACEKVNHKKPIFLHIGTAEHKNLQNVILALSDIECHLRIIGKLKPEMIELLKQCGTDYSNEESVDNDQMLKEYQNCDVVSFPSLHEGFGLPIIEAQAVGRPVVTSNVKPMNDIAGERAVLVNPLDVDSIKQGFIQALSDWETVVKYGLDNVKRFSPDRIAEEYYSIYKEVLR